MMHPVGYYLVVITLHHKGRHRDRFQIVGLVCLRESLDAFVVGERAPVIPWRHQFSMTPCEACAPGLLNP